MNRFILSILIVLISLSCVKELPETKVDCKNCSSSKMNQDFHIFSHVDPKFEVSVLNGKSISNNGFFQKGNVSEMCFDLINNTKSHKDIVIAIKADNMPMYKAKQEDFWK